MVQPLLLLPPSPPMVSPLLIQTTRSGNDRTNSYIELFSVLYRSLFNLSYSKLWSTLADTYARPTRGHVKQLKQQMENWTKGTKTIDEYVQGFTTRFDHIAFLWKPVDHEDQIDYLIGGIPEEYKTIIDQIEARDTPPSITDIHEKLINHELKLQAQVNVSAALPITGNAVSYQRPANNKNNSSWNQKRNYQRNNTNNNQTWQHQQNFNPRNNQHQSTGRGYQGRCQLCGVQGHSARRCPQLNSGGSFQPSQASPWQPRPNIANVAPYSAANWILDSGALTI